MNHRAVTVAFGLLIGIVAVGLSQQSRRQIRSPNNSDSLDEQIIENMTRIGALEVEVKDLQNWKNQAQTQEAISGATTAADIRELKVEVEHHEKFLWAIITACILLVAEGVYRAATVKKGA